MAGLNSSPSTSVLQESTEECERVDGGDQIAADPIVPFVNFVPLCG